MKCLKRMYGYRTIWMGLQEYIFINDVSRMNEWMNEWQRYSEPDLGRFVGSFDWQKSSRFFKLF